MKADIRSRLARPRGLLLFPLCVAAWLASGCPDDKVKGSADSLGEVGADVPAQDTGGGDVPTLDAPGSDALDAGLDAPALPDAPIPDEGAADPGPADAPEPNDEGGVDAPADLPSDPGPPDIPATPPPTFDLEAIADPSTAACTFEDHSTVFEGVELIDVWKVSYLSWESIDGQLQPILIRGYAARPASGGTGLPGVVQAHGLGGFAKQSHATGLAALLDVFVIAYTGPGGGDQPENTSQGLPAGHDNGYRMFDTIPDVRGSWFWGHAVAGMRGLTCLENHPEVDPTRLGMTGYSAGGVVTLMSVSVDPRIKAAVPLSGTGAWDVATQSPDAWQHNLLALAGLDTQSEQWLKLQTEIDAEALAPGAQAPVIMVNGSSDEFFPLTAHMATYDALGSAIKRTSIAANFDHGCYAISGGEAAADIEARAALRAEGAQRMLFHNVFGTDSDYDYLPLAPEVTLQDLGGVTVVSAVVDNGGASLDVEHVKVWGSADDCFLWIADELDDIGGGVWSKAVPFPANAAYFVDVQYKTKDIVFPERFSLSSRPILPAGLVPHIREQTSCL